MIEREYSEAFLKVEDLATYLGLPSAMAEKHSTEIASVIERATVSVENQYNISLRSMEITLRLQDVEGDANLYYHPILDVTEVRSIDGLVPYEFYGMGVSLDKYYKSLRIKYTTGVINDQNRYRQQVLSLAANLFNDTE